MNGVYDNRELSWLKFNKRVLQESEDIRVPLFERLRFISIFSNNLDEFYMIRVGSLIDQHLLQKDVTENKTNMTPALQLGCIATQVKKLTEKKDKTYAEVMNSFSDKYNINHIKTSNLNSEQYNFFCEYFINDILPFISPNIIEANHPFPFFGNKEIYVGVILTPKSETDNSLFFGFIPASGDFPRIINMPGEHNVFMLAENLIMFFAHLAFPKYDIIQRSIFRITRNADINVQEALFDQEVDLRNVMQDLLKKRRKLGPVRLEMGTLSAEDISSTLAGRLDIDPDHIYTQLSPLDMSFISQLEEQVSGNKELFYPALNPQLSAMVTNESIFKQLSRGDIFLSFPFESFTPFIKLLEEAADDPNVSSIKITLYRVARESKIINALIKAAENGKDVLTLVELRARFDEENNIGWSKRLEDAGVDVIYGPNEYKVHSKLLLITRKSGAGVQHITQIGTGNYNERTSKLYTDMMLITTDKEIGEDAVVIFNKLVKSELVESVSCLLVAPLFLRMKIVDMIDEEIKKGHNGFIGAKLNSLSDKLIIDKLIEASCAGVKVDLIVRGICCLVGGVAGISDNIRITSIVGRFLEHSRIYIFGKDEHRKVYISSADFMTRNTTRRVEVAVPIKDLQIKNRIIRAFEIMLADNVKAYNQQPNGTYVRNGMDGDDPLDSQIFFYKQAYEKAKDIQRQKPVKLSLFERIKNFFKK